MTTLVLGSTGFLGKYASEILRKSDSVYFLRRDISKSEGNLLPGNLLDDDTLKAITDFGFRKVIDFSWSGLPNLSTENNKINLESKKKLYSQLTYAGVEEINAIGSCLEYGSRQGEVQEDIAPLVPNQFAQTKILIHKHLEELKVKHRWFRCFYLIGPGQHANSLINSAIINLSNKREFTPKDPSASFDYIDVRDAARAIVNLIENESAYGTYNIASGKLTSVVEVTNCIKDRLGLQADICPKKEGMYASIEKLASAINWIPTFTLQMTIDDMIKSNF